MEADSGTETSGEPNGAGGDASQALGFREFDSGISGGSKSDEEASGTNSVTHSPSLYGKRSLAPEDVSMAESHQNMQNNLQGVEDVERGVKNLEASALKNSDFGCGSEKNGAEASNYRSEKRVRLSPQADKLCEDGADGDKLSEEKMCAEEEDSVLNLDLAVEGKISPRGGTGRVQVDPVLSSSFENSQKSLSRDNVARASTSDQSAKDRDSIVDPPDADCSSDVEESQAVAPDDLPSLSDDLSDLEEEDDETVIVNPELLTSRQKLILRKRRRMRRQFLLSSSSDSNDDADSDDNEGSGRDDKGQTGKESDNEEEIRRVVQGVLDKPMPQPNWFALQELRKREYCSAGRVASTWFRERVQSSLHMVRRLVTVERMKAHEGCVNALSFNRIGTLLASGSDDLDIVLWNWQKARPSVTYESGHRSNVFQAKFMPFSGDCHVISCARDGQVRLAELNSQGVCRATRKLAQHRGAAHKLALEHDSPNVFMSCGEDALTYLFDLRQEKPHRLVTAKENDKKVPLYSIHSNPADSNQFCVGGRDNFIRVFDKRKISEQADGGVFKKLCPDHLLNGDIKANVTCACYSYNGAEILGTYNDEDIYLFDNTMSDGANYVHKYEGHRNSSTVKAVNFYGPKSEFIISGSDCGHVYFWDKETEAIINFQDGDDTGVINALEPHPTLPVLATSGLDHDVKLWMPMLSEPNINRDKLKKVMRKNQVERNLERCTSEPEIGGQMLWFIMNHFRNNARRRMREEGQELSSSDDDEQTNSDDSESNQMQCVQS